jgi:hypothetical protein
MGIYDRDWYRDKQRRKDLEEGTISYKRSAKKKRVKRKILVSEKYKGLLLGTAIFLLLKIISGC